MLGRLDAKYDLVALVHESAESAVGKLKQIGYLPRIVPTPINESDIESEYYRSALKDSGCCGASELIKLEVFNMIEYEKVVMLDADMILLAPIHDLLRMDKTVLFAYDREMGGHCIQGGFFIVEPSTEYYDILIATVLQGDYRLGTGWGGKNIGWCYGGSTIQGLLSYFVNYLLHPTDGSMEVDSCRIDGMDISENNIGENCTKVNASTITLFHFTDCFKPWYCQEVTPNSNCANMVNAWWTIRYRLQNEHQIDNCINGQYTPLHQYTA